MGQNSRITSGATGDYNCVGWAVEITDRWVWPDKDEQYAWPSSLVREETVQAFEQFFGLIGYRRCQSSAHEAGWEKVAIFVDDGRVVHVALQLISGKWTSKLGELVDIEHVSPADVGGGAYGQVVLYLKRRRSNNPPPLPDLDPQEEPKFITI